jgi:hypothetical protein
MMGMDCLQLLLVEVHRQTILFFHHLVEEANQQL